jgi:hypothetical protein
VSSLEERKLNMQLWRSALTLSPCFGSARGRGNVAENCKELVNSIVKKTATRNTHPGDHEARRCEPHLYEKMRKRACVESGGERVDPWQAKVEE